MVDTVVLIGIDSGSYFYFNGTGFVGLAFNFNGCLSYGKLASGCWGKKVGIGFRKSSLAVYPLMTHRLIRTHNHPEAFKIWSYKIIAVFVHFKINSQALIYSQLLFAEFCLKLYLCYCTE